MEILLPEFWDPQSGPIYAEEGDQQRFWKLTRRYLDNLVKLAPGKRIRAVGGAERDGVGTRLELGLGLRAPGRGRAGRGGHSVELGLRAPGLGGAGRGWAGRGGAGTRPELGLGLRAPDWAFGWLSGWVVGGEEGSLQAGFEVPKFPCLGGLLRLA